MGKLFGTDGIRDRANRGNMTADTALRFGRTVASYFRDADNESEVRPVIVIGRDPRLSGAMLESALVAGICSAGVDARLLGVVPTPAVAHITVQSGAVAGIAVSASHNPFCDNGIKVFKGSGFKLTDEEEAQIEALFRGDTGELPDGQGVGTVFSMENALELYAGFCTGLAEGDRPFAGLRLVLDCSNGAASPCAASIFRALGADVDVIHDDPDGININDNCGSQHTADLRARVVETGADAGLAFDGDADRLIAVDAKGTELTGDQIMAICARAAREKGTLNNDRVVATVMSNVGFHAAMKAIGVTTEVAGVGDRQVLELMQRTGAVLGGEDSGHMIFLDCHTTGDGIVSGIRLMQVLCESDTSLEELAKIMTPFPQRLVNIDVRTKPPIEDVPAIVDAVKAAEEELGGRGRILIRYSGTQSMCRVMVEGPTEEQTGAVAERLAQVVKESIG